MTHKPEGCEESCLSCNATEPCFDCYYYTQWARTGSRKGIVAVK